MDESDSALQRAAMVASDFRDNIGALAGRYLASINLHLRCSSWLLWAMSLSGIVSNAGFWESHQDSTYRSRATAPPSALLKFFFLLIGVGASRRVSIPE